MPAEEIPESSGPKYDPVGGEGSISNGSLSEGVTTLSSISSSDVYNPHPTTFQGFDNPGFQSSSSLDHNGRDDKAHHHHKAARVVKDTDEDDLPCGLGPLQPVCCQSLRNIKLMLFFLCVAGAIQGMVVNGFVSVVISTIEKRFELRSTQSGIIASSYDIASVICLIPVSYFGGIGSKPRWLGVGVFLMGVGSFIFALPHFLTGLYLYENSNEDNTCMPVLDGNVTTRTGLDQCEVSEGSGLDQYRYVLILGQLLHGVGATPLYTLGVTYLDENLKAKLTSLYVGIFYAMAIVGPALGYLLGGVFLDFYCDFDTIDTAMLSITPNSPVWVGAWWLGFLLSGALALVTAVPILAFPKFMPDSSRLRTERVSEAYKGSPGGNEGSDKGIKAILVSIKVLLTNPTFMFLNLAGASEGLLLSGFAAFTPKFIESQFSIASGWAAMLVGFATIPAGGGGTLLGGYIIKRSEMNLGGVLRLCLVTTGITLVLMLAFLIQCPVMAFAGVNRYYGNQSLHMPSDIVSLDGQCNADCECGSIYQPVCGDDHVMYFSPCYAGCNATMINGTKVYHDCSCIASLNTTSSLLGAAEEGKCESDCILLPIFLVVFAFVMLFTFVTSMPALSATLRCVPDKQKSLALGIQWIMVRCLGTIPAPIAFGALIDKTCQLWQGACDDNQGSCYFYDNTTMSYYLMAIAIAVKFLSFIFFVCSLNLYKPPAPRDETIKDSEKNSGNGSAAGVANDAFTGSKDSNLNVISEKPSADAEISSNGFRTLEDHTYL